MLRARYEAEIDLDDEASAMWHTIVAYCHTNPPFSRFVREHPYAPAYYMHLLQDAEAHLPSWAALRGYISYAMSTDYSMGIGPFEKDETLFQCFNDLIACLYQTIVASKDPNLLFLSHLSDVTLSLTERLGGISRGWLIAGAPDFLDPAMDDVLQHAIEMAGVVSRVLKKEISMQEAQEESE